MNYLFAYVEDDHWSKVVIIYEWKVNDLSTTKSQQRKFSQSRTIHYGEFKLSKNHSQALLTRQSTSSSIIIKYRPVSRSPSRGRGELCLTYSKLSLLIHNTDRYYLFLLHGLCIKTRGEGRCLLYPLLPLDIPFIFCFLPFDRNFVYNLSVQFFFMT